jgi:hypothetical protein
MDSCVGAQCSIHMHVGEAQRDIREASSQLGTLLQAPKLRGRHTNFVRISARTPDMRPGTVPTTEPPIRFRAVPPSAPLRAVLINTMAPLTV